MESRKEYDYLIVGAGLFGAVFHHVCRQAGKKCLIIDRRDHIGGNIYCENIEGINVHKYGPHIFHTNDERIWSFVNSMTEFRQFVYSPMASYKGELYNLPFNMNTFYRLWGTATPEEAKKVIAGQIRQPGQTVSANLEEQAMSQIGQDLYEKLVKGYSEKQWGRDAKRIPAFVISRIPLRFTFDNNYFSDRFQGIPVGGYNRLVRRLLEGAELRLSTDFLKDRAYFEALSSRIVYTGRIDELLGYKLGRLDYRSLRFETEILDQSNYQGNAVINYTEKSIPYTRIIEHKHFEMGQQRNTVITREYPAEMSAGTDPFYPINDEHNNKRYTQYRALADLDSRYILGGRLADYKYYNMDQIIGVALDRAARELSAVPELQSTRASAY